MILHLVYSPSGPEVTNRPKAESDSEDEEKKDRNRFKSERQPVKNETQTMQRGNRQGWLISLMAVAFTNRRKLGKCHVNVMFL